MEEIKVTVTKDKFMELMTETSFELAEGKAELTVILLGGIVTGIFCDKLFADSDSICLTKKEFSKLTAEAISEFAKDDKNSGISTPVSLLAIVISGKLVSKYFDKEEADNE